MLQVISDAVYSTVPSLRQAGMEFTVWVFKHGASEQLEKAAPEVLEGLWAQLESGGCPDLATCLLPQPLPHKTSHFHSTMSQKCFQDIMQSFQ